MQLQPAREQAAPTVVMNEWLRKHQSFLFNVVPFQAGDPAIDSQENHKSLVKLLNEKNIVRSLCHILSRKMY